MESLDKDTVIFKNKSLSDLLGVIYDNSTKKQKVIESLLESVKPLLANIADVSVMLPILKEVLDVSVKNDEQLIKVAAIIQRLIQPQAKSNFNTPNNEFIILSDTEKADILKKSKESSFKLDTDNQLKNLQEKITKAKEIVQHENAKIMEGISK